MQHIHRNLPDVYLHMFVKFSCNFICTHTHTHTRTRTHARTHTHHYITGSETS